MKRINADKYYELVMDSFPGITPTEYEDITVVTESKFKIQWFNFLHFSSYIAYADYFNAEMLLAYMNRCRQLQRRDRSNFLDPRVCNTVVICEKVNQDVINIALTMPKFSLAVDVFPVVVDLKNGEIYYYNGPMYTRLLYNRYERNYIDYHFGRPLRTLKQKLLE